MSLPKTDVLNRRRKEMLDMISVTMAGRIAEEIVSGTSPAALLAIFNRPPAWRALW
jgi:ATP-dependent Zn protease